MRCRSCDTEMSPSSKFCPQCGEPLLAATADADETTRIEDLEVDPDATRRVEPVHPPDETEQIQTRSSDRLSTCPACGAANSSRRQLCGRCGADLRTGLQARDRVPTDRALPGEDAETGQETTSSRALGIVLIAAAVLGMVIGGVVWFRTGPVDETRPVFDAGVYTEDPGLVPIATASATSSRSPEGERSFAPSLAVDGDPRTAWVHGQAGEEGVGEALEIRLSSTSWVTALVLWIGDQHGETTFVEQGRPRLLRVTVGDHGVYEIETHDVEGAQVVRLPEPVLGRTIVVELLAVTRGSVDPSAGISEIEVNGWEARGADRDLGR